MAEMLSTQAAVGVDQQQGRGALKAIGSHRGRDRVASDVAVDTDGKADPIFVEKSAQAGLTHRFVMLEHAVQADDGKLVSGEKPVDTIQLRYGLCNAAWA